MSQRYHEKREPRIRKTIEIDGILRDQRVKKIIEIDDTPKLSRIEKIIETDGLPILGRIKRVIGIENQESLTIQGQLSEKETQINKLESKNVVTNFSDKRERNVSKGRNELTKVGKENKKKGEVTRSRHEENNLKRYSLRS